MTTHQQTGAAVPGPVLPLVGRCRHVPGDIVHEIECMDSEYCQCQRCGRELERAFGSDRRWRLSHVGLFYPANAENEAREDRAGRTP